jgi:dTDP-3,4-didehydro-2,6-dideoxy-alpha-D-glucose 3-reductase
MIPSMKATAEMNVVAVASRDAAKAHEFGSRFGCAGVHGYQELLDRPDVDAVYIPLPPALHEEWVLRALEAGKHVLVEKPFAVTEKTTTRLLSAARSGNRLAMENFQFEQHSLFSWVRQCLDSGTIGETKLLRSTFTIPPLSDDNIRYQEALGGGARLDLGSYMVRFALDFLGEPMELAASASRRDARRGVDVFGTIEFRAQSRCAQLAYGFDTHYQNTWEFLGSAGRLTVERGFTAPPSLSPVARIERSDGVETLQLPADNQYLKMCQCFARTALSGGPFDQHWEKTARQAYWLARVGEESQAL